MRHGRHNSGVPAPIDLASVSDVQPFPEDDAARMAADPANASRARSRRAAVRGASSPQRSPVWQALGICAELLITAAVICALYIVWQMWWTGVEAERAQNETTQSVDWSDPSNNGGTVTIAKAQEGDAPVQPKDAKYGDLIAQIYIPRFGSQWHRNIVEGTTLEQLNRHGLGHYDTTQMPGQVGNFAVAGHRNGYGQPLGDVDKLQEGDPIIVRTKDYWYVYHYTSYKIVLPTQTEVVAANPENPGAAPTKRMLTMTTCEPKYSTPTHRWISYAEFSYWAKIADGIPQELASQNANGTVKFVNNEQSSFLSSIDTLKPWIFGALAAYVIIFISAAVAWRWPYLADVRAGRRKKADFSLYGSLVRLQPGVLPIRLLLVLLLQLQILQILLL